MSMMDHIDEYLRATVPDLKDRPNWSACTYIAPINENFCIVRGYDFERVTRGPRKGKPNYRKPIGGARSIDYDYAVVDIRKFQAWMKKTGYSQSSN